MIAMFLTTVFVVSGVAALVVLSHSTRSHITDFLALAPSQARPALREFRYTLIRTEMRPLSAGLPTPHSGRFMRPAVVRSQPSRIAA